MKIDYFCFSVPSIQTPYYIIDEDDDDNLKLAKQKENELMRQALDNDKLILYDRNKGKFYKNNIEIDVSGMTILPRCTIPNQKELLLALQQNGAYSINTIEEIEKITHWPLYIQPIHRKIIETTYGEFGENADKYRKMFNQIFFKTVEKSRYSFVLERFYTTEMSGVIYFITKPPIYNLGKDTKIFLSEVFDSIDDSENKTNCIEYRIFVIDGQLFSISRSYVDYPTEVPEEVRTFVQEQIDRALEIREFPKNYVLDVGEVIIHEQRVIDIIEYNPVCSSGLEVCNDLVKSCETLKGIEKKRIMGNKF